MRAFVLSLLLFLPFQKPPAPASKAVEKCTLQGVVVRADTGEPLKKALLALRREGGGGAAVRVLSDAAGRFEIKAEAGRYHLSVSHNGYVSQEYGEHTLGGSGTILTLASGQKVSDLSFRLMRAAVISGYIYDEDGEPMMEVQVTALRYSFLLGQRQLAPSGEAMTNDRGEFRIYGLSPGQYYVRAADSIEWGGASGNPGGYSSLFYPGVADVSGAAPIVLRAGDEFSAVELNLQPVRAVSIRGRIIGTSGAQSGRHGMVFLVRRDAGVMENGQSHNTFVQDPQGAFELRDVTPGGYYVYAVVHDRDKSYLARAPVEVAATDVEGLTLAATAGLEMRGQLRVEGTALTTLGSLNVHLQRRNEGVFMPGMSAGGPVNPDGSFTLRNVFDGDYEIDVHSLPEDYFLKSARLDGIELIVSGLTVESQQAPKVLELVVSANGARLEGVVQKDQQPFGGATVALVPDPPHRDNKAAYRDTTTDQYGHFELRGVSPGDYKLFAWESVEGEAYLSSDFLQPFESRGYSVHVTEGARTSAQLELIPSKDSSQ